MLLVTGILLLFIYCLAILANKILLSRGRSTHVPNNKIYLLVDPTTGGIQQALVTPHPIQEDAMASVLETFKPQNEFLAQHYLARKDIEAGSTGSSSSRGENDEDWDEDE